ncbi:DUF3592 domain-containing protein [Halobacterium sp. KA-6]|uniref:DUF3592 domain-containing protein n=1 Tax=Halobacterium sp. KA-6 TaxID=2896368 RepID=UPI001E42FDC9|nr:DUF3592 domain-containing protein [Halobacterium sp. KA-6]MCD2204489.1 DUF3592 domain-containing protein [Halobacterium sp. KA-6]
MELNGPTGWVRIALALLFGVAAIAYGGYSYMEQTSALDSAATVEATVTDISVETNSGKGDTYTLHATYNYTYAGDQYTSSNVYPGKLPREFNSREDARSQLAGVEPGDTVSAYVPSDAPGNAYLKHESSNKPFLVMGIGLLLVVGAIHSTLKGRF